MEASPKVSSRFIFWAEVLIGSNAPHVAGLQLDLSQALPMNSRTFAVEAQAKVTVQTVVWTD